MLGLRISNLKNNCLENFGGKPRSISSWPGMSRWLCSADDNFYTIAARQIAVEISIQFHAFMQQWNCCMKFN